MIKRFDELFTIRNGMITPKATVKINGVTMTPGVSFGSGMSFGGIDLSRFIGRNFVVDLHNGIYIIQGVA
jgi:hypothetical protein